MTDEAQEQPRPLRPCDLCVVIDDHPRHVYGTQVGDSRPDPAVVQRLATTRPTKGEVEQQAWDAAFAMLLDDATTMRHLDCCRAAGCPDGTCDERTAGAEDLRGMDLVAHLTREGE